MDAEFAFQYLEHVPSVCADVLRVPTLDAYSSVHVHVATAISDTAMHMIVWILSQLSVSKQRALSVSVICCIASQYMTPC